MMRAWILSITVALFATSCGGASFSQIAAENSGRSIAVVSLSINDFGGSLQGWNSTATSDLMFSRATSMLQMAEQELSRDFQVIPAPQFVQDPAYQELAGAYFEVAVPRVSGQVMPVFAEGRGQLIKASMSPGRAQALTQATRTDFIAVVYAEWGVATGSFVPTSKALSKNVVSIFDASGRRVFHGRKDARGNKTLGAFGRVVVDENSVDQWVDAYRQGIARIFSS